MKKNDPSFLKWMPMVSIGASLIGGCFFSTIWIVRNVPQTTYVDELMSKELKYIDLKSAENMKYIDDKISNLRAESFAHSDMNKSGMESEYKGLSAKLDMLILMIQEQRGSKSK